MRKLIAILCVISAICVVASAAERAAQDKVATKYFQAHRPNDSTS
jgi:hypothetical protein